MTRIYICYGITKSASTFAWQLIKRTAISRGLPIPKCRCPENDPKTRVDILCPLFL